MLIAVFFVLSLIGINGEPIDQDGLRKSRQLDLGLQDIRTTDGGDLTTTIQEPATPTQQDVIDGYLPPVSSSLSPNILTAQSQQTFDFKSINSIEKENELCKPPYDKESCKPKESSVSESKISEPSRELVPPFNDLEKNVVYTIKTTLEPKIEETRAIEEIKTTEKQFEPITTTDKIVTKLLQPSPTIFTTRIITTTQAQVSGSKAEATNELRSYLPPQSEYSAAAQQNFAVTQPQNQNNFNSPTKLPTNQVEEFNELKSYLPPQADFSAAAQTNVAITQPPADNNHHHDHHHHHHDPNFNICDDAFHSFLCAPLKARKRITGALPTNLLGSSSYINYQKTLALLDRDTAPSNEFRNEYLPPRPSPNNFIQSSIPTKKVNPITSTTNRPKPPIKVSYKPNQNGRIPNTLFARPVPSRPATETTLPTSATSIKNYSGVVSNSLPSKISPVYSSSGSPPPKVETFSSFSSNENNFYLPPSPNPQPAASFISSSENSLLVTSTITPVPSTFVSLPAVTTFSPLPSSSYTTHKRKKVYTTTPKPYTRTSPPSTTNFIAQTSSFASQPSENIYLPPSSESVSFSKPSTTTTKPNLSTYNFIEQNSNIDNSYLPPDPKEPAAAQISPAIAEATAAQNDNPAHQGRDPCTDPFHSFLCTSSKPRKRITGQLPSGYKPESSNTDEVRLKSEPSSQDESKVRPDKSSEEPAAAQNVGYNYPKPVNPLPSEGITSTLSPSTGYSYPKPDKIFPLPSQQDIKVEPVASSTTKKPDFTLSQSVATISSGYQYSRPEKNFPLPTRQDNTKVTTVITPTTGYSYPKPQKPFPLPTEQKEVRQKPKPNTPSTSSPTLSLSTNQVRGYQYNKPDQSLVLPEKKGYSYPKPEKRLELPTESRPKSLLNQNNFNIDPFGQSGSVDFIPVNKVDYKRGEPSKLLVGLRKFGERMKKRERQSQLLKRQLH